MPGCATACLCLIAAACAAYEQHLSTVSPSFGPPCSRVALAVQLVRRPGLLLLDEPLAGLDWRTRGELIQLLKALKNECTMLVVSHDLRELSPLVDAAWEMLPGGQLVQADLATLPMLL